MNIPLDEFSGSGATKALHETIKKFVDQSDRQTRKLIGLTWAILILTVTMVAAVAVQIYEAWPANG